MWPFSKKKGMTPQEWNEKCTELARHVVKVMHKIGPQVGKTVFAGKNPPPTPEQEGVVCLEVLAFCVHVCERELRERFAENAPSMLLTMLAESCATVIVGEEKDDLKRDTKRREVKTICKERYEAYRNFQRVRAKKGESEIGTLVDGFAKLMTECYSGKNALARAMLQAQGIELAGTMPLYLDHVGLKAA